MTDINPSQIEQWTRTQATVLALICLAAGVAGGWTIRASQSGMSSVQTIATSMPPSAAASSAAASSNPAQLKEMADSQATPLLDRLKSDPDNFELLTSIGNIYYDAQQYPAAIDFYARALKVKPSDADVRTDMATAYWYTGNADSAIAEFNKALAFAPNNPNTLFNLGLVKLQGKKDSAGAIAVWEKLLAVDPQYQGRAKVEQMLTEAKKQLAVQPALKAN
jgi:cytochrome c-type biogenesis protein CcmH/NrfG